MAIANLKAFAMQTKGQGLLGNGGNFGSTSSVVSHANTLYYITTYGQEAAGSTTMSGTNPAVWTPFRSGGPSNIHPLWASSGTYFVGGPYITQNPNARNVFVGAYAESGQAPCRFVAPTTILPSFLDEVGVLGNAVYMRSNQGVLDVPALSAGMVGIGRYGDHIPMVSRGALDNTLNMDNNSLIWSKPPLISGQPLLRVRKNDGSMATVLMCP